MFIQTKSGDTSTEMEFFPGVPVLESGSVAVTAGEAADKSPLAARLYEVDGVQSVTLTTDSVRIGRSEDRDWEALRTEIFAAIMAHFQSGEPAVHDAGPEEAGEFDAQIIEQVKDLLKTRIIPAVTQSGGDVSFHSYKNGILYLKMQGSAFTMLTGITNMLRHYIPEITAIADHREALPRPGLHSPAGLAIRDLLRERINPSIAAHGGHISLVDVQDNRAFVRLEGGCQGCGMADVTLKEGVSKEITGSVPGITEVLDVTDHAEGTNPYYQPA
jgi:Fe-S cluster biogenesis protein NfuA